MEEYLPKRNVACENKIYTRHKVIQYFNHRPFEFYAPLAVLRQNFPRVERSCRFGHAVDIEAEVNGA